jgi:uncharacterized protein YjdB
VNPAPPEKRKDMNSNVRIPRSACSAAIGFVTLSLLTIASGCGAFFVNPTVSSVQVGPVSPFVQQGRTQQMIATVIYSDGSSKRVSSSVNWTTNDANIATVSSTGLVSGIEAGTAIIAASSGTVAGSTSVTVTLADLQSITVTPTNAQIRAGQSLQFKAIGSVEGGETQDITDAVSWISSDANVAIVAGGLARSKPVETISQTQIHVVSGNIASRPVTLTVYP